MSCLSNTGHGKECEKLNGILAMNSIPLPALNAVVLTKPGAVRPDLNHLFLASCLVCVMRLLHKPLYS